MRPEVLLMRMVRGLWERAEVGTWLVECYCQVLQRKVPVQRLEHGTMDCFPHHAARNSTAKVMLAESFGILFMVDHDMVPSPSFFRRAVGFLSEHNGPILLGSPYRTGAPNRWVEVCIEEDGLASRVSCKEAAQLRGIKEVAGVGTGLVAINRAAFELVEPPYFDFEFTDASKEVIAWGEDHHFCRKLIAAGGKVMCDWESWSGHAKIEVVEKPDIE